MPRSLLCFIFFLVVVCGIAQDTLVTWHDQKIPVRLLGVRNTTIKYKLPGQDSVSFTIGRDDVKEIIYVNGLKEKSQIDAPEYRVIPGDTTRLPKVISGDTIRGTNHSFYASVAYGIVVPQVDSYGQGFDALGADFGYRGTGKHLTVTAGLSFINRDQSGTHVSAGSVRVLVGPSIRRANWLLSFGAGIALYDADCYYGYNASSISTSNGHSSTYTYVTKESQIRFSGAAPAIELHWRHMISKHFAMGAGFNMFFGIQKWNFAHGMYGNYPGFVQSQFSVGFSYVGKGI